MVLKNKRIIVFDLESTCEDRSINPNFPMEIIEIGAVDNLGNEFSEFIKPTLEPTLTNFCKNLTKITQENIDTAKPFSEVYPKFLEFIQDADIVFSWGAYDKKQINADMKLNNMDLGLDYFNNIHYNLKEYYLEIIGKFPKGTRKPMSKLGIVFEGTQHRAIDDSRNYLKIYNELTRIKKEQN